MRVLLFRPVPGNERFGLGPFFRVEPLGMEYIAASLEARGHDVTIVDLRFGRPVEHYLRTCRPGLVGIACLHALEIEDTLALARRVKQYAPDTCLIVGGNAATAYPAPFFSANVDAICADDGEAVMPALVEALEARRALADVPGIILARREAGGERRESECAHPAAPAATFELDDVPLPSRRHVDGWRNQYACLLFRPTWLVETARGCPFRCSFCSVWQLYSRSFRIRSVESVCRDFAEVGPHVFITDDLFWHMPARSAELAKELLRRGLRKRWVLVQSRVDTVANHPELLEAWRPFAKDFDIFFGLEAATNQHLNDLVKDTTIDRTAEAVGIARELGFQVTGNFVIDPAWDEADFENLWAFVEKYRLGRAGYTILTPLPGTAYFDQMRPRIRAVAWEQFDMHHLVWEPRLGPRRFFELYCETWRRSILNLDGDKPWWKWAMQARLKDLLVLSRMLRRTQHMMNPEFYLAEHRLAGTGAPTIVPPVDARLSA
jgi:radical SAM superfamily enzyme YgiQ (UPF0313 family)